MTDNEKVTLMTVHTAKGLEYNYVFIYSFNEGVFPNERSKSENGIEEERRLAYVAITRAKKELFITSNRDYSYVLGRAGEPSMFVKEAGLKTESPFRSGNILFASKPNNNSNILYRFNKNDSNKAGVATKKSGGSNFFDLNKQNGNGISWNVGDKLNHTFFGDGVVKAVEDGNIIVVEFANFGVKKLLGNHKALSKKGD